MDKEIKFRAWDKIDKKLRQVVNINFDLKEVVLLNEYTQERYTRDFDEINLMQYIGLKDKNDKEIYERDIIKVQYAFTVSDKSYNFKVCYDEDNAGFLLKEITKSCGTIEWFDNLSEHEFEVIGNIYENPELLKEDNNERINPASTTSN